MKRNSRQALRAVLFDWDGTLLNSFAADAFAYDRMFRALGVGWSMAALKRHYSPDWYRVYRAAHLPADQWELADRLWARYYRQRHPLLQPGSRRVLQLLQRQYVLALVSSGNRSRVLRQVRECGLSARFRTKVCSEDAARRKPHPQPIRLAMRRLRLQPSSCVYVGDAPEDIVMARRAGVRSIGVLGGSPVPQRLREACPDALIGDIGELPLLLRRF